MSGQTQPETALQSLAEKLRTDAIAIFGEGQAERDIIEWFYAALLAAAQSAPAGGRDSYWFSLVMNCAAELETASYCMTDTEAKRVAQSGAGYYRDQARAAWQRAQGAVPKGWSIQRVFNPSGYTIQMPDGGFLRITDFGGGGVETAFAKFICAILANPTQQGEAVEVAQVVSYLSACADGYDPYAPHPGPPEPLMTVAQHQRILADMRQQLADVFEGNTKLHVLWTETVRQRDKLAQVLGNVEREHELIRRMKNCEIQRGRGSFGIAVMSDPPALEWQALDKELQQLVDTRRAALAASTGQEVGK